MAHLIRGDSYFNPENKNFLLPLFEHSPWHSYIYARDIIKGRWIEVEDIIMTDLECSGSYAESVIKGKLPEKMHNMMILYAIENPDHYCVKKYFDFIERK